MLNRRQFTAFAASAAATRSFAAADRVIQLQPAVATRKRQTHAALAVSNRAFGGPGVPFTFSGQMRTVRQLRTGSAPHAWEVAWLVWNFIDDNHLYYFVLKPNGWEYGKRDPRYFVAGVNDGQKVIATGESHKLTIGQWYDFDIRALDQQAAIRINGEPVCDFRDTDVGGFVGGRVGLYTEDAQCQWNNISAPFTDTFEMEPVQVFADGSQLANWTVVYLGYGSGGIVTL